MGIVKVEIYNDGEYWCARGLDADVFTQGKTLDELMENIREATELHFEDSLARGERLQVLLLSEMEVESVPATAAG